MTIEPSDFVLKVTKQQLEFIGAGLVKVADEMNTENSRHEEADALGSRIDEVNRMINQIEKFTVPF